tara:strand:- start:6411 stop:7334 length:924 start_codon:yes stop_codon:yes gene_type:complete
MAGIGTAAIIGGALKIGAGIFGASKAKKRARALARQLRKETAKLNQLEKSRQQIVNPYDNVSDASHLAVSQAGKITNPFANLSVATKASEIQMEQSDLALANTLDTMRATGAGAGGATALAQAALQSKQGVAASIETQEAGNNKLRAEGQASMESQQAAEEARVQGVQVSEQGRVQQLEGMGRNIQMQMTENRQQDGINYQRDKISALTGAKNKASVASTNAITGMMSSLGSGMMASDRRFKNNIKKIGLSPSGLNIYTFEYKNKDYGSGVFQGVMSDEIPQSAVIKHADGFDRVDYSKLDVEFKQV